MTKCEKCKCEFDELEMVIMPMEPEDNLSFLCMECYALVLKEIEKEELQSKQK